MIAKGEVLTVQQVWEWGRIWYEGRFELGWRRRTVPEMESVFEQLGFSGPFWSLANGNRVEADTVLLPWG